MENLLNNSKIFKLMSSGGKSLMKFDDTCSSFNAMEKSK